MRIIPNMRATMTIAISGITIGACSSDNGGTTSFVSSSVRPQIVVTTDILGDIVGEVVGDLAALEVVMPSGVSPHEFQASARQAETMENADLLITNGAGFEAGMADIIESVASGETNVFTFADAVDLQSLDDEHHHNASDDHAANPEQGPEHREESGSVDDADGDHDHDSGSPDPHLWTDPQRISTALEALEPVLGALDGLDATLLDEHFDRYQAEIQQLITDIDDELAVIPPERRVLVTNHEVFGYFADRFDFRVAGAIIPSLSTNAQASAAGMDDLVDLIDTEGVPAIFVESTQSTRLANAIAAESDADVDVVQLFSESLGEPSSGADTYLSMMRANTSLITQALTP